MTLKWMQTASGFWQCFIVDAFVLRIQPGHGEHAGKWHALVIAGQRAAYRSARSFEMDAAKLKAIQQGAIVARRLARTHTSIAEILRVQSGVSDAC